MKIPDIKKIFKKFLQPRDKDKLKIEVTPWRDWRALVIIFTILVIAIGVANFYVFIQIERDEIFTTKDIEETPATTFNTKKLKDTIATFEQKKTDLEVMHTNRSHIIDPSQ